MSRTIVLEDKEDKNLSDKSSDSNVNKSVSGEGDSKNIQHTEEKPKASNATDKEKTSAGESKTVIKKAKKVKNIFMNTPINGVIF